MLLPVSSQAVDKAFPPRTTGRARSGVIDGAAGHGGSTTVAAWLHVVVVVACIGRRCWPIRGEFLPQHLDGTADAEECVACLLPLSVEVSEQLLTFDVLELQLLKTVSQPFPHGRLRIR